MKLKYYFLSVALAATAMVGFTACSDDDDAPVSVDNLAVSETTRVKIGPENRVSLPVLNGAGDYRAFSLDPEIADVVKGEDGLYYVEGFQNGKTTIVVSDASGTYKSVGVAVYTTDVMKLNYNTLEMTAFLGAFTRVNGIEVAEGNGVYSVTTNDDRVTATVNATTGVVQIVATPEEEPIEAIVTVKDQSDCTADIKVTVSVSDTRVKIGTDTRAKLDIDPALGEATVESLSTQYASIYTDGTDYYVEGLKNGSAKINIFQGETFRQLTYSVYTTEVMTLNQDAVTITSGLGLNGSNSDCEVVLGNGGYTIESNHPNVSATIGAETGYITITAKSKVNDFTAQLTVTDCTGLTATIDVTVKSDMTAWTQTELNSLKTMTTKAVYGQCKDPSDGTAPYYFNWYKNTQSYWTNEDANGTHTVGWWFNYYGTDYGGIKIEYPTGTAVDTEVDGKLYYQYSNRAWYDCYEYTGKVKVLVDEPNRVIAVFWNIDLVNERINRGYVVYTK